MLQWNCPHQCSLRTACEICGLETYASDLARRGYVYAKHILPHDVDVRELGTGVSRLDVLMKLSVRASQDRAGDESDRAHHRVADNARA